MSVSRPAASGSSAHPGCVTSRLARESLSRFCVCIAIELINSSGRPASSSAYGMTDANGCPGWRRESVASVPARPRYASVRARSANVGSGTLGASAVRGGPAWRLIAPPYHAPRLTIATHRAYPARIMRRDLGDGLVMRSATEADADRLGEFNADVLRGQDAADPAPWMGAWTRDLVGGRHPSFRAESALLVEDTRANNRIVSSMVLLSHTWTYGGVPIAVGQPEIVGTRAEVRGRGLVRAMFDVAHHWSAERRQQVLAINGIPWFYRQFGYEMALELGGGPRLHTPGLAAGVR